MASITFKFSPLFTRLFLASKNEIAQPQILKSVMDQPFQQLFPINLPATEEIWKRAIDFIGRNSRQPKRPNHGARPCSHVMRRLRKKAWYKKPNFGAMNDQEAATWKL